MTTKHTKIKHKQVWFGLAQKKSINNLTQKKIKKKQIHGNVRQIENKDIRECLHCSGNLRQQNVLPKLK